MSISFGYPAKSMVLGNIFPCVVCACQKRRDPAVDMLSCENNNSAFVVSSTLRQCKM